MRHATSIDLARDWTRLGVLFGARPGGAEPDLERLLLETARQLDASAGLLPLVVTWLAEYGSAVARHRLARLVLAELEEEARPALALLLELATAHGAPCDFGLVTAHCRPAHPPRPLNVEFRRTPALAAAAERNASPISRRWGLWVPEIALKHDALRPPQWLIAHNPTYRDRLLRKGDLRTSIVEALRHDAPDRRTRSEAELARLAGATRAAVRKALQDLVREGEVVIAPRRENSRDHEVALRSAA